MLDEKLDDADLYAVLRVDPKSTFQDIKQNYRGLARILHPDKSLGTGDPKPFLDLQRAYQYLYNPVTRLIYDNFGHSGLFIYENNKKEYEDLEEFFMYSETPKNILEVEHEVLTKTHNMLQNHLEERLVIGY